MHFLTATCYCHAGCSQAPGVRVSWSEGLRPAADGAWRAGSSCAACATTAARAACLRSWRRACCATSASRCPAARETAGCQAVVRHAGPAHVSHPNDASALHAATNQQEPDELSVRPFGMLCTLCRSRGGLVCVSVYKA